MSENPEKVNSETTSETTEQTTTETQPTEESKYTEAEKQMYARLKKAEAERDELKKTISSANPQSSTDAPKTTDFDTLAAFVEATRDLVTEELSELRSEAKELGLDPMKYISSKAGKAHLEQIRATAKSKGATTTSAKVKMFNNKPVDDIFKDPTASPADKQKAFEEKMRKGSNQSI